MPDTQAPNKEVNVIEPVPYTEAEIEYRDSIKRKLDACVTDRKQSYDEFDGMTYEQFYITNKRAAEAYIAPKNNDQDVRVVSGVTKEKNNTILSMILNYNLEPNIEAYNKYDELEHELGKNVEDMVRKSRKMEMPEYDRKRILIYRELFSQGNVFTRETNIEYSIPKKELPDDIELDDMTKITWDTKKMEEINKGCNTQMISGLNVYPGNIRQFFIELQPHMVIRYKITREEAQAQYGGWARWKYVPKKSSPLPKDSTDSLPYNNWTMLDVRDDMVEVVEYENKWVNEMNIFLNGVMMLPVGFPLSFKTGKSEYSIAKGDCEPVSDNFFYSKGIPAKTKVDQAVFDEMLKGLILKTRRSYNPPMINNTGVTLSSKIFYPGKFTQNVNMDKLKEVGTNEGVTQPEISAFQIVKQVIDEKSLNPIVQGNQGQGKQTAREVVELKQQSLMRLGLFIVGVINLEKQICNLRIQNIISNWTKPIDTKLEEIDGQIKQLPLYRTIMVESEFDDGQKGKKIIEMTDKPAPHPAQIMAEEDLLSQRYNTTIRKTYMDRNLLKAFDGTFYIEIIPTEKSTSDLKAAIFSEDLAQANQLWPGQVNAEYTKTRWANMRGEDPTKFFIQTQPNMMPGVPGQMPAPGMPMPGMPQGGMGSQMAGTMKQLPTPSLNTVANA